MKPLVVGFGQATVAISGIAPRLPEHSARVELSSVSVQPGGAAAIATATVALLGFGARFCTKVADDFLAPFIRDALSGVNIDLRLIQAADRRLSAFSFSALVSDYSRRMTFATTGDVDELHAEEIEIAALLHGASVLLVDGFFPLAQAKVAEEAHKDDIPVVLAGASLREGTGELVALADILICSERLASELAPRGELKDSLVELQRLGPRVVILTLGRTGSIGLHDDQLVDQPAFPVDVVDPAGAGDVYSGAFVAAMLNSLPFSRCMEFASAAAALSCSAMGPWAGIPSEDEVVTLVRESR